ncbi:MULTISPECIES: ADP-ribosylglycohydrolase family protein [unclassified Microbacterium]|uniref:ADP-ribosylglycohydrolase family protein n=1 Tax=unclassified Microbacterium TaxID=2609290 RepID=UPI000EA96F11|nr:MULTISPECIES: ADP-ribosylglycohydrolase family protein [unclassified Microbacterium]MBT2484714.1 ADP-ribosylglycohydrolase family protein [Microbacterium sp. ISL-108]RKN67598.1 ADP-ribosylglycohydrolase family protein [Microbacterium sp. CGR2]
MRLTWAQPEDLVPAEFAALREQGVAEDALAAIEREWADAGGPTVLAPSGASATPVSAEVRALARLVLDELARLQTPSAEEPDDWDEIVALLPTVEAAPTRAAFDRVHGAWLGRAAGCLLGKPVEKIPREGIEEIARATGNWPIERYFTAVALPSDIAERWPWNRRSAPTSLRENIDGMPEDDDLNFPILALDLLETHGDDLTTDDVAQAWLAALPAGRVFTAERAAYRNILDARPVPETATHLNPFREWIGAMIRADVHGWAHPGDARAAAASAWTDARLSHTRNGIYGEMWAAALCSASIVVTSIDEVLDAADGVVPPASRLASAVRLGRDLGRSLAEGALTADAALDRLHTEFAGMHWVHTLNNAALTACALQAHGDDFGSAIALAVAGGWDTDSVGATVGSVVGGLLGADGIDETWTSPLRDRIATSMPGGPERSIRELAERTLRLSTATP